jgi:hypothetical protein
VGAVSVSQPLDIIDIFIARIPRPEDIRPDTEPQRALSDRTSRSALCRVDFLRSQVLAAGNRRRESELTGKRCMGDQAELRIHWLFPRRDNTIDR